MGQDPSKSDVLTVSTNLSGGIGKLAGASGPAPMSLEISGRRIQLAGAPRARQKFVWFDPTTGGALNAVPQANCMIVSQGWETYKGEQCYRVTATATDATTNAFELLFPTLTEGFSATSIQIEMAFEDCTKLSASTLHPAPLRFRQTDSGRLLRPFVRTLMRVTQKMCCCRIWRLNKSNPRCAGIIKKEGKCPLFLYILGYVW